MNVEFYNLFGNQMKKYFDYVRDEVFLNNACLNEEDECKIIELVENLDRYIEYCERLKLNFGRLLDYNGDKKNGMSLAAVEENYQRDQDFLDLVDELYIDNEKKRKNMFGYPANMEKLSFFVNYFRYIESKLYLINNCGDPYQAGNYGMDSKAIEQRIIDMVAENFGLSDQPHWGYITSGGTESNFWAIREAFNRFPNGKLYFSAETHYSVEKFVNNNAEKIYPYKKIPATAQGEIDYDALIRSIEQDVEQEHIEGVILVLTWGTTEKGSIDPVQKITDFLRGKGYPYYCHLDAALFGGIPKNQTNAPLVGDVTGLNIDSVSVSLHKFLGMSRVNGVLIALNRANRKVIDYIGQEDSTLLGSRDFLPFSTYQRLVEVFYRKPADYYAKNVEYFADKLQEKGIGYQRFSSFSNIFVIDKPSDRLCKKYQLSDFSADGGRAKAHIIIFPFHEKEYMDDLIGDLSKEAAE